MQLRKAFSISASPLTMPRILGTKRVQIPAPRTYHVGGVTSWDQDIFISPIRSHNRNISQELRVSEIDCAFLENGHIAEIRLAIPAFSPSDFSAECLAHNVSTSNVNLSSSIPSILPIDLEISNIIIHKGKLFFLNFDVSTNIFIAIQDSSVRGKKYIENEWKNAFKKITRKRGSRKSANVPATLGIPVMPDDSHATRARTSAPSFFDIIRPLLLPPPIFLTDENATFLPPGKEPYGYQRKGINKLVENRSFLLADEMGTGKTVMATLATRVLLRKGDVKRVLILSPVSVLRVWEEHLYDWSLGEIAAVLVRGTKEQRRLIWKLSFHVFITSYDTFSRDMRTGVIPPDSQHFDLVILDEAQYIKNQKSARFRSLQQASFDRKWAMTGTPLENRVDDVKSIFEFLLPGLIHPEEISPTRIREYIKPYMLRRLKKDVLSDLPPKRRQWRWLEMSKEQRQQYDLVRRTGVAELVELEKRKQVSRVHIFTLLGKLRKICNFPQGKLASPKADEVLNLVEEIVASGNKVVIFSQYIEDGIAKLAKILDGYNVVQLTGSMNSTQREIAIRSFRNDPTVSVFLISLKAGGTGLTLTEASYVILFDHWWNPAVMTQAEDRVHRAGQKESVMIYELGMEDTIERRIYKLLEEKKALAGQVIDGLAEEVDVEDLDITVDEWLHRVLQILPKDKDKDTFTMRKQPKQRISHRSDKHLPTWNADNLNDVRDRLYAMHPTQFEKLVAEIFSRLGYPNVHHIGQTSDGGVDVFAQRYDKDGAHYAIIQCKRYRKNVGVRVARDLAGVLSQRSGSNKGYLVTSSDFTAQCKKFVAGSGGTIELINGLELSRYILLYGLEAML